jgi:hypothetical protein
VSGVLVELGAARPPKVLLYFADQLRKDAGRHYLDVLGPCAAGPTPFTRCEFALNRLLEEAAVAEVRLYPVQAQGTAFSPRFDDAKGTLITMALETGGRAFVEGVSLAWMTQRLEEDLGCMYLIAFDPEPFPADRNLPVRLRPKRAGVSVRARGLIAIQSPERRRVSRLVQAFQLGSSADAGAVRMASMPLGYADGEFRVLFQAVVPSPGVVQGTWDFGISAVHKHSVEHERSGRLERVGPDLPLVVETVLELKSGTHEVVGVLDEPQTERTLSAEVEQELALPAGTGPQIVDLKLFEETPGVYWRDGQVSSQGSLIVADGGTIFAGSRVTVKWLVCRDPELPGVFRARRALRGMRQPMFDKALEVNLERETCQFFQNALPADSLSPGRFTFDLQIHDGSRLVAQRSATFRVER